METPVDELAVVLSEWQLLLGVVTLVVTVVITALVAWSSSRDSRALRALQDSQRMSLDRQEMIHRRQRRDALLDRLSELEDPVRLQLCWAEIAEFGADDQRLLKAAIRANPHVNLPVPWEQLPIAGDVADEESVGAYVLGMGRRYSVAQQYKAFDGLPAFIEHLREKTPAVYKRYRSDLVSVLTGPCAGVQKPTHQFFRELVKDAPELTSELLHRIERMPADLAGIRLNVLTGTLLAAIDVIEGRATWEHETQIRHEFAGALAALLNRETLRYLNRWDREGFSEAVSATVAWLVRVVGWTVDADSDHIALRMVEKLAYPIRAIPEGERGWGADADDIAQGFAELKRKKPWLWDLHGQELLAAADEIGPWREASEFSEDVG